MGGVTTSTIHFVYFRFPTAVCIADTVQRPIGSIIDHKLFPPRLDAPDSFFTLTHDEYLRRTTRTEASFVENNDNNNNNNNNNNSIIAWR
jgi:hypothetical protein